MKALAAKFGRRIGGSAATLRRPGPSQLASAIENVEGWLSREEAELLYSLARDAAEGCIVEVGTYRGRATIALALGTECGRRLPVYTLDPHEEFRGALGGRFGPEDRGQFYRNMLSSGRYRDVRLLNVSSEVVTPGWQLPVALLWIDGDHAYEGVKRDVACWTPHLTDRARVVFDDSANPTLGPANVIADLLQSGGFEREQVVGKVTVLRRIHEASI